MISLVSCTFCGLSAHDASAKAVTPWPSSLLSTGADYADERVIEPLLAAGKTLVIPPKANRKVQRSFDNEMYKARHLIENFFCKLKQFRAIATRYVEMARNFLAGIQLAAAVILLN